MIVDTADAKCNEAALLEVESTLADRGLLPTRRSMKQYRTRLGFTTSKAFPTLILLNPRANLSDYWLSVSGKPEYKGPR